MAHVKAQKTASGNRDSAGKRRGVKVYGNQLVKIGSIIVRQKGTKFKPADGTKMGRDFTIYAIKSGKVQFFKKKDEKFVRVV